MRDEGIVRLSAKAESDRITEGRQFKSAPRNHFVKQKAGIQDSGLFRAKSSPELDSNLQPFG
jgi:hypothetical protein